MKSAPFGNHPDKLAGYLAFWRRDAVPRPLIGFSLSGWFPLQEFRPCRAWKPGMILCPEMIRPAEFIEDHLRLLREGEVCDDDLLRGACPAQAAIPWLPAMLGCPLRVLPDNVLPEERRLSWDELTQVRWDAGGAWSRKFAEFVEELIRVANARFPVSHCPELGPSDLHALLRGHGQSILDLADDPERASRLLEQLGEVFVSFTQQVWSRLPLYHGGYFDAQYCLWAPGPICRLQEDATALYSPRLYRRCLQDVDRAIARHFPFCFMHLHSTSMHLLDAILEIESLRCLQVNRDVGGPPLEQMIGYYRRIQASGRSLLIRGSFTADELRLLIDRLDARGLLLYLMVENLARLEDLRKAIG